MSRSLAVFFGMLCGAALMFTAFQFHTVRSDEGFFLVRKKQVCLQDAYVDVRNWTYKEWRQNPRVTEALVRGGHAELVDRSVGKSMFEEVLGRFGLGNAPPPAPRR